MLSTVSFLYKWCLPTVCILLARMSLIQSQIPVKCCLTRCTPKQLLPCEIANVHAHEPNPRRALEKTGRSVLTICQEEVWWLQINNVYRVLIAAILRKQPGVWSCPTAIRLSSIHLHREIWIIKHCWHIQSAVITHYYIAMNKHLSCRHCCFSTYLARVPFFMSKESAWWGTITQHVGMVRCLNMLLGNSCDQI